LILPSEFGGADDAVINFGTNSGNNQKLETKIEYNNEWIQIYDDNLTITLSSDLPTSMIIDRV
jgi:hypothetical protein